MEGGWLTLLLTAVTITGAGFIQSSLGFGYAIVSLAVLPCFLDIRQANIVVSLSVVLPLASELWAHREGLCWSALLSCLAGAALGLPLGMYVFLTLDTEWLTRCTGLMILLLSLDGLLLDQNAAVHAGQSKLWSGAAGVASGVLGGSVGIGGPPIVLYAARQPWSPVQIKAFLFSFALVTVLLRCFGFIAAGLIDHTLLFWSAMAVPFALAGSYWGARLTRKMRRDRYRRLTMIVLLALSIGMIVRSEPQGEQSRPARTGSGQIAKEAVSEPD